MTKDAAEDEFNEDDFEIVGTYRSLGTDGLTQRLRFFNHSTGAVYEHDKNLQTKRNDGHGFGNLDDPDPQSFWSVLETVLDVCSGVMTDLGHVYAGERKIELQTQDVAPVYTELWYAEKIATMCEQALEYRTIDGNLPARALWLIFKIGKMYQDWEWRLDIAPLAIARNKQIVPFANHNEGRSIANAERAAEAAKWHDLANAIASETQLTGMARARWVATTLLSRHAIRKEPKTVWSALRSI